LKEFTKYFLIILILGFAVLSYLVVQPFIATLIASAVVTYMFFPLFKWMNKWIKNKTACSFVLTILLLIIFLVPMIIMANSLFKEIYNGYGKLTTNNISMKNFEEQCNTTNSTTVLCQAITQFKNNPEAKELMMDGLKKLVTFVSEAMSNFIFSIPEKILQIFVAFFTIFFLFIDGARIVQFTKELLPLKIEHRERVMNKLREVMKAIIYGYIIVAIVQGTLAGIGYAIFGVKSPIFWAIITTIAALIPFMGTALVWLPISAVIIISGITTGNSAILWKGLGLLIYGTLIVGTIDNILRPKLVGEKGKISPLIVLVGALGGLKLVGFLGFIVGPLILALFITIMHIYVEEREK